MSATCADCGRERGCDEGQCYRANHATNECLHVALIRERGACDAAKRARDAISDAIESMRAIALSRGKAAFDATIAIRAAESAREAAERDRDSWLTSYQERFRQMEAATVAAKAEVARLREALLSYSKHGPHCDPFSRPCSCGLSAVLVGLPEIAAQEPTP